MQGPEGGLTPSQKHRLYQAAELIESVATDLDISTDSCPTCGFKVARNVSHVYLSPQLNAYVRKLRAMANSRATVNGDETSR